jgi:biopolymer transport protein TolQ
MNPADIASSAAPLTSSNLSLFHLFWHAHWIVESVMAGLLVCSVWVWAIAIDKTLLFARLRRAGNHFEEAFWSGQSLEELYKSLAGQPGHSTGALFVAAMREWKRSLEGQVRSLAGLQMRIEKVMDVAIAREVEHMERRLLVLATVGSAGPFIGLFGTVAGIMTSFQSIAASQNTSLAVVAPGIAEALFATAIGLVAAIPATIFYNKFSSEVNVTPFVDVMLVLLIVFMVSAPLLTVGVPIELPQSQAKALEQNNEPMAISINDRGQVFLQNDEIKLDDLLPKLKGIIDARGGSSNDLIYIRGDRTVAYGMMMRVMGRISGAGYHRVALVTEVEQGSQ